MELPHFASGLSDDANPKVAEGEALGTLEGELDGRVPDLLVAFATLHHGPALRELGPRLCRATGAQMLIGCTAESVIGGNREIEGKPGLALWAARLPESQLRFFHLRAHPGPDDEPVLDGMPLVDDHESSSVLIVADPFSFQAVPFLSRMDAEFPGVPVMGGLASGATRPGQSLLFTADGAHRTGAVGVVIEGGIELRPVVSQGCRPVGKPWVITACEHNVIEKLGGRPAIDVMMETWNSLSDEDKSLMLGAPFVGLAIDATRSRFERGDFLVRGLVGTDQDRGAIAVADLVRRGGTVQFLVRDAASAGEDLHCLMATQGGGALAGQTSSHAVGALIFSCNGRGTRMFDEPNHDIGCVRASLAEDVPVAGFFTAGEMGPVGGRNFLHGLTASVAVFRARG